MIIVMSYSVEQVADDDAAGPFVSRRADELGAPIVGFSPAECCKLSQQRWIRFDLKGSRSSSASRS